MIRHLFDDHKIDVEQKIIEKKCATLRNYFQPLLNQKKRTESTTKEQDKYRLARQLVLWIAMDLMPFLSVQKQGFMRFSLVNFKL